MSQVLADAIEYCRRNAVTDAVFVIPSQTSAADLCALRKAGLCTGIVVQQPDRGVAEREWRGPVGWYSTDRLSWILPAVSGPVVFVGSHALLTFTMVNQVRALGHTSIVCMQDRAFRHVSLIRFRLWQIGQHLNKRRREASRGSPLRLFAYILAITPGARHLWRRVMNRRIVEPALRGAPILSVSTRGHHRLRGPDVDEAICRELLSRATRAATGFVPVPGRVLMVNHGLAAGGTERQLVNTLVGLRRAGVDVSILGEYLFAAPGLDFHLATLRRAGVDVDAPVRRVSVQEHGLAVVSPEVAELFGVLPILTIEEILNLVEEFRVRRPETVHAWQDDSSIKAGIAAVIVGVPRIVLGTRSLAPMNFSFCREHMWPAYRALAELPSVKLLNNSEAGALDYCRWLGLDRERFVVVRNGVELSNLGRAEPTAVRKRKRDLEIPIACPVVGSIFRLSEEKRPLLWINTAAKVADEEPSAHFLLVGDGPMRMEAEKLIERLDLIDRVHLVGEQGDVSTLLSAMDLFLLTSRLEGTPNALLEAQYLGVPAIITPAGGAVESIQSGSTGRIVDSSDPADLAKAVVEALGDREWRQRASTVGPVFVEKSFGLERMLQETLEVYGMRS